MFISLSNCKSKQTTSQIAEDPYPEDSNLKQKHMIAMNSSEDALAYSQKPKISNSQTYQVAQNLIYSQNFDPNEQADKSFFGSTLFSENSDNIGELAEALKYQKKAYIEFSKKNNGTETEFYKKLADRTDFLKGMLDNENLKRAKAIPNIDLYPQVRNTIESTQQNSEFQSSSD